jgi:formiminotetrahydrofolate cyclodeaminase
MLLELADEDAAAYGLVNELSRLPEGDPRRRELPSAQEASVRVPMAMSAVGVETLRLLLELCGKSNHQLRSDLAIAAVLAEACTRGGQWNVLVNAPFLADARQRDAAMHESRALTERAVALARDVERACHGAGGT